ncbi:TlpA disulfide reductase family protein [Catellatospora sp. KI3]|uniref:TlpA family protein disulfide reductase n=1 Tax=Catellatospora sp. KI3 TaxID=3041620 RepID=UPI0024823669|nr:TlpA disulfide reductase family protein [Catellatospora sp. KI3]MDI1465067.1 TlpA disulfide reductase family protein [Catellatospora sp. KI3]
MRRAFTLLAAVTLLAGCTGPAAPDGEPVPQPFAACTRLAQDGPVQPAKDVPDIGVGGDSLPHLSLACMAGGGDVSLTALRGPLVINVWASWCPSCREELPALQRLAASGRVPVLGVVSDDDRDRAAWLADDLKISMPTLYDRKGRFKAEFGALGLPLTVFLRADGSTVVHPLPILTDEALAELVDEHFGAA